MVDLPANVLRLDPTFSKTKKGRVLPIPPPLRAVLDRRLVKRRLDCQLVFHVDGQPMGDWRKTWARACVASGLFRAVKVNQKRERRGADPCTPRLPPDGRTGTSCGREYRTRWR